MAKKQEYLQKAEKMYVEQAHTLKEIANKLPISLSTVKDWKRKHYWEKKRNDLVLSKQALHLELYELAREIAKEIKADIRAKIKVVPSRIFGLGRIIDALNKMHGYESKVSKDKPQTNINLKDLVKALHDRLFEDG